MADEKPRILQGNRDIIMSLVVLMVICAAFAGLIGQCSFSPGGPKQGAIPEFDLDASLNQDARSLPFAVREPAVPEGWTPNSGRQDSLDRHPASHAGFVTTSRTFLDLVQSSAPVDSFRSLPTGPRPSRSTVPVLGREWTVFTGDGARTVWATDLGDARVGIVGDGSPSDFEKLATAIQGAAPLPSGG